MTPLSLQQQAEWAERRGELEVAARLYIKAAEAWRASDRTQRKNGAASRKAWTCLDLYNRVLEKLAHHA